MDEYTDLHKAAAAIKDGGIILYPTDTVWGLGCDASNETAVKCLFDLKKRPDAKAMISLVDSVSSLERWIETMPEAALAEIDSSYRPLTIIYDSPRGIAPSLKAEDGSAAFRITSHPFSKELCRLLGKPLVSTSANISGSPAPSTFKEIDSEIINAVDYVCLTDRDSLPSTPSRILKISDNGEKKIIRN